MNTCAVFDASHLVAAGPLPEVAGEARRYLDRHPTAQLLVFDDATGEPVELDLRGTPDEVVRRLPSEPPPAPAELEPRRPGRPKLGVVAREVTLLPRHWEWLAAQPGGASVALRKLVEQARLADRGKERIRRAQNAAYRFLTAIAGNEPGYEESLRALFGGQRERFEQMSEPWPPDVRAYARRLAAPAFER
jgi:hypothetical protein